MTGGGRHRRPHGSGSASTGGKHPQCKSLLTGGPQLVKPKKKSWRLRGDKCLRDGRGPLYKSPQIATSWKKNKRGRGWGGSRCVKKSAGATHPFLYRPPQTHPIYPKHTLGGGANKKLGKRINTGTLQQRCQILTKFCNKFLGNEEEMGTG